MIAMASTAAVALLALGTPRSSALSGQLQDKAQQSQSVQLVGRLLDEDCQPICEVKAKLVEWDFSARAKNRNRIQRTAVALESDSDGRFKLTLAPVFGDVAGEQIGFVAHAIDVPLLRRALKLSWEQLESFEIELPEVASGASVDLGDIQLVRPGSIRWLADKDDAGLEAEYRRARTARQHYCESWRAVETCLTEIVRRGGSHWESFVSAELARERATTDPREIDDLPLLTALRRIQGKSDPLSIQVVGLPELECTFPQAPTIPLRMRNVDVDGELFQFTFGWHFGGENLLPAYAAIHFAVEVLDASGTLVPAVPVEPMDGDFSMDHSAFERDIELSYELPLELYLQWPAPGEYQMRVLYHDEDEIGSAADCRGWICSSSSWLVVHVKAKRIRLDRAEYCALADRIAEIDLTQPVLLVRGHWGSELAFDRAPEGPQDHLFHAGWKAVPALLEALESKDLEPRRRAWVLGMLWNITGVLNPAHDGALGAFHWSDGWPGTTYKGGKPVYMEPSGSTDDADLQPEKQRELTQRWLALRKSFDITIVD